MPVRTVRRTAALVTGILALSSAALIALPAAAQAGTTGIPASIARSTSSLAASPQGAKSPKATAKKRYVTTKNLCGTPKRHHMSCFGVRLVRATAKTVGARALTATPDYVTGPAGGYTPAEIASAYGVNPDTATTQVVGIVDAFDDPNALTDLNTFNAHYGLPTETATSFRKVSQTGSTTTLPTSDSGWAGEISLDLDAVRGVCHKCRIVLVEANSSADTDLAAAENEAVAQGATVISNSYGSPESGAIPASTLSAYKHSGIVILASAGDNGMYDWDQINDGSGDSSNAPQVPSSLNTVVAVGGTSLYLNDDSSRSGETVWNENGSGDVTGGYLFVPMGATGGGCSTQVTAARWQQDVANYAKTACGTKRLASDISALADPYTGYDSYDSFDSAGWGTLGGTSLASPIVAGLWAMAGGSGGVTYPALSLYGHFTSDTTPSFNDITSGGNGLCDGIPTGACLNSYGEAPNTAGDGVLDCAWLANSATLSAGTRACNAATGYDGPSGLGTPKGLTGFKALTPKAKITVPATVTHKTSATFSGSTSTDPFPGGTITSYAWTWGDGTSTAGSTAASAAHTYAAAGTFTVKLTVTDVYGSTASTTTSVTVH